MFMNHLLLKLFVLAVLYILKIIDFLVYKKQKLCIVVINNRVKYAQYIPYSLKYICQIRTHNNVLFTFKVIPYEII